MISDMQRISQRIVRTVTGGAARAWDAALEKRTAITGFLMVSSKRKRADVTAAHIKDPDHASDTASAKFGRKRGKDDAGKVRV